MNLARAHFLKLIGAGLASTAWRADAATEPGSLRIGIVTDCQYADIPDAGKRLYRRSPGKLQAAVDAFNGMDDLHLVCHLGDMIDQDLASYARVMPIFAQLKAPRYQLIGNHDYSILDAEKVHVPTLLGMKKPYYSMIQQGWRLIMLDGNEQSLFSHSKDAAATAAAKEAQTSATGRARVAWGGGLGTTQRQWLAAELAATRTAGQRALLFCHYPVLPISVHSLWDAEEVLEIIKPYADIAPCWFNGHNHDGSYVAQHGIHFLNFRGMLDTEQNSYARLDVTPQEIKVTGWGREPQRVLRVPAPDTPPEPKPAEAKPAETKPVERSSVK